jgi:hypothetical protein
MKTRNLIGLWVNLSRAYEIALLGGHTLTVTANRNYKEAFDDYQEIKSFYKGVKFVDNGDICCEIDKPHYTQNRNYETLEEIIQRVNMVKVPVFEFKNTASGEQLLKTAVERLSLSLKDVEKLEKTSVTIARLDGSTKVELQHLAEAIQYCKAQPDNVWLEKRATSFGDQIFIGNGDLEVEDMEKAIEYLQNRIDFFKK